jgi:hypothetical protein
MATALVCVPASSAKGRELLSGIMGIGATRKRKTTKKRKVGATKRKKTTKRK